LADAAVPHWIPRTAVGSLPAMPPTPSSQPHDAPPLGSWARVYTLVCALAILVMVLLWWFTAHFNVRMGSA